MYRNWSRTGIIFDSSQNMTVNKALFSTSKGPFEVREVQLLFADHVVLKIVRTDIRRYKTRQYRIRN